MNVLLIIWSESLEYPYSVRATTAMLKIELVSLMELLKSIVSSEWSDHFRGRQECFQMR